MMTMSASQSQSGIFAQRSRCKRKPLFREQASTALQRRWFGPVQVLTPPSARVMVFVAAAAVAMLLVAATIVEIPDRIRTVGVLLPVDGLLKVRASRAGRIEKLAIANGEIVARGQVLMRISGVQHAPGKEPELAARIASLRRETQLLDETLELEIATVKSRMQLNRRRLLLTQERIKVAAREMRMREQEAERYGGRAGRVQQLAKSQVVSDHVADEAAAAALQALAASQATRQRSLSLQDEIVTIEQQLLQDSALPEILRGQADLRRETIAREIAASELQSAHEITAHESGVVAGLAARVGEDVRPGEVLMTLHNPDSRLEARIYLSPDNAGMIAPGQRVELQLKAYPHQLYGTQTAIVESVSAVAVPAQEIDTGLPFAGPVFEVRAALLQEKINVQARAWSLPPGTSFTADLVRHRWPLYRWLLRSALGDASNT
jgi:membrane fusion protein